MHARGCVGEDPAVLATLAYAVPAHPGYSAVMGNDPGSQPSKGQAVADPRVNADLQRFMNPVPKWRRDLSLILHITLVKFIFMMLIIFGLYDTIFAWAKFEPGTCSLVADRELGSGVWVAYCVKEQ